MRPAAALLFLALAGCASALPFACSSGDPAKPNPAPLADGGPPPSSAYDANVPFFCDLPGSVRFDGNETSGLKGKALLDFRRNPVHVADWPGGASPAPGLPCFRGPEPLAAYLLNQGIRYVAYSYADQCNFPRRDYDYNTFTLWDRVACQHAYDFQDNLSELMKTRERVYDDGRLVMLDLGERVKN